MFDHVPFENESVWLARREIPEKELDPVAPPCHDPYAEHPQNLSTRKCNFIALFKLISQIQVLFSQKFIGFGSVWLGKHFFL